MTWEEKVDFVGVLLWVPIGAVLITFALPVRSELAWQWTGGALELFGFVIVAYQLHAKWAHFSDSPTIGERLRCWLRKAWNWLRAKLGMKPPPQTVNAGVASAATATASATATVTPSEDASLDERVDHLERKMKRIEQRIDDLEERIDDVRSDIEDELDAIREEMSDLEDRLEALIKRLAVGSFRWEIVGLLWFVLGVVAGSWASVLPGL